MYYEILNYSKILVYDDKSWQLKEVSEVLIKKLNILKTALQKYLLINNNLGNDIKKHIERSINSLNKKDRNIFLCNKIKSILLSHILIIKKTYMKTEYDLTS